MYGQDGGDPMRKAIKWISAHAVVSLCIAIIALLVLSTLAFNLMFDQTLDAIDSQSNHLGNILYTQIRSELDSVLNSASELVSMISSNNLVHQFAGFENPINSNEHYSLYELFKSIAPYRNIAYNNRMILDFAIYYPKSDVLLNMQSVYKTKNYYEKWYQDSDISFEEWLPLIAQNNTGCFASSANTDDVLVYIQSIDVSQTPSVNFLVFFDRRELEKTIRDLEQPNYRIILTVDDVNTVSGDLPEDLTKALSAYRSGDTEYKGDWTILSLPSNSLHNASYLICEKDEESLLIPQRRLRQFYNVATLLLFIIVMAALLTAFGVTLMPIFKRLKRQKGNHGVNNMMIMKDAINVVLSRNQADTGDNDWLIVKDALLDLLTNTDYSKGESLVTLSEHDIILRYPYFLIAIFFIQSTIDESLLHQISKSCNNNFGEDIVTACFSIGKDRFAALFNMKDPDMNYLDAIEKIRSEVFKSTKNETTVFVGSIQEGTSNIHQSYNDAVALFEYEIFTGSNAILDHNAYLHSDTEYYYPMDIELSLISAVSNGNKQRVSQILNEIHEENFSKRQLRPDIAKLLLNELAGTTMKVTKNVDPDLSQNPVTEIMKCNTVEDVFFTLQDIYLKACEKNQETFGTVRKERFKQYIDQHYCDVDFSQSNMAEELGVSQNYLSSQFKAYFGVTMISYVNSLRAEKAASLLKSTEIPVQEIATACGFSNGDSLTRVFKKQYGVTPSDYRSGI